METPAASYSAHLSESKFLPVVTGSILDCELNVNHEIAIRNHLMSLIGSDDHFAILFAFDHVGTTCLLNRPNLANLPAVVGLNRVMLYQVPRTATVIGHGPVRIGHGPVRAVPEIDFELTIAFSCIKNRNF